jgi:hypothetical protein
VSAQSLYPWESADLVAEEDAAALEAETVPGPLDCAFRGVPEDCEEVRLSVRVWSRTLAGAEMYALTGWLHVGGERVWRRLAERDAQIRFEQADLDAASWVLARPKTRKSTTEFLYRFARGTANQHEYKLRSAPAGTGERRRKEVLFARLGEIA